MLSRRILQLGMFMAPFALVRVVSGFGLSVGDVVLIVGCLGVLYSRAAARTPHQRSPIWAAVFVAPGLLIILSVIVSALVNQNAPTRSVMVLTLQYGVVLVLVPLVLAQEPVDVLADMVKAFVYGLGVSIAVGLVVISVATGIEENLLLRGWMVTLGGTEGGRQGLFTGVGELSRAAGMSIWLIYYLGVRGRIGPLKAGALIGLMLVALIVSRSGSGTGAAIAALAVVTLLHLGMSSGIRQQVHRSGGSGRGLLVGVLGAIAGMLALRKLDSLGTDYREAFLTRIVQPFSSDGIDAVGSAQIRQQLISQAWTVIGDHPLFGIGPGLYQQQALYGAGVHVVPLMMWAETGIVAVLAWLLMMLCLLTMISSRRHVAPIASVAASGVFVVFAVTNLTAPYIYARVLILPMLLAFYMLTDDGRGDEPQENAPEPAVRKRPARRPVRA